VQRAEKEQSLTTQREQKIASALSYYAQTHNKLPCPSKTKPTLASILVGEPDNINCANTAADRTGIVPFRTLGLTQQDVTDGYGNPIDYTVSKLAADPSVVSQVHYDCRNSTTWNTSGSNANADKARFCCPMDLIGANQLIVNSDTATSTRATTLQDGPATNYRTVDDTSGSASTDSIAYFAYVLVSHGQNGKGAYKFCQGSTGAPDCTGLRVDLTNAGADEQENFDDDNTFVATTKKSDFDDVVLWRTQSGVISELNNDSCASPNVN
jgi:hypothetical protein